MDFKTLRKGEHMQTVPLGDGAGRRQEKRVRGGGSWPPWPLGRLQEEQVGSKWASTSSLCGPGLQGLIAPREHLDQSVRPPSRPLTRQLGSGY